MKYKEAYEKLKTECERLKRENAELKRRLSVFDHSIARQNAEDTTEEENGQATFTQETPDTRDEAVLSQTADAVLQSVTVTKFSSPQEKIELFMSLFRGRTDLYAKRWYSEKSGKSGYQPVCANEWNRWLCDKRNMKCGDCKNRKFAPLTQTAVYKHLEGNSANGTDTIGIYPLTQDDCCYFLAMDFDGSGWKDDIAAVREVCAKHNVPVVAERSRSGQGGHLWFFFTEKTKAATARKFGTLILNGAMQLRHSIALSAYDRVFPNQDFMPKGGFGNLIALPLQGRARVQNNSVFVDEHFIAYTDQWSVLSCVQKIDEVSLHHYIGALMQYSEPTALPPDKQDKRAPLKTDNRLSKEDFPTNVTIVLSDMLHIEKAGVSERALFALKRLGVYANPEYYKAQKMRLPLYNKPRFICAYAETDRDVLLPRGRFDRLRTLLKEAGANFVFTDARNAGEQLDVSFNGTLREEQSRAFTALNARDIGVLSATTAFGKTVVGARMIAEKKRSTLVLVHTSALLNQWKDALTKFLSFGYGLPVPPKTRGRKKEPSYIGQLGATKNTLNGKLDIVIMQSLCGKEEVKPIVKNYGLVIVDECHHVPASTFERVMQAVNAKYVYGLTATPVRADGRQESIFMQCGDIVYKIDAKEQAQKQLFEHFTVPRFTDFRMPLMADGGLRTLNQILAQLSVAKNRNKMIIDDTVKAVNGGRTPIVLTERTEHARLITDELERQGVKVFLLIGKESAKVKREKLAALAATNKTEKFALVAIGKYVGEGFDFARLDTLFLAMPISWKGKLAQYAGRLHRDYAGKSEVIIYDYVDLNVAMLENMYHRRLAGYKEIGYEIRPDIKSAKRGILYDKNDFKRVFDDDVAAACKSVFIVSPVLVSGRVTSFLKMYGAMSAKPDMTVITRFPCDEKAERQIERLQAAGIHVLQQEELHLRCAVIDDLLVWYGSIHPLGFAAETDNILRFDSKEIASMLLTIHS